MGEKVVGLRGEALPTLLGEPCADVIEALEGALRQARAGRVRAVAITMVTPDYWASTVSAVDGPYRTTLIGAAYVGLKELADGC